MSAKVFRRLELLFLNKLLERLPDHEERVEIDREIEARTDQYCNIGINRISDAELKQIVEQVKRRKKKVEEIYA